MRCLSLGGHLPARLTSWSNDPTRRVRWMLVLASLATANVSLCHAGPEDGDATYTQRIRPLLQRYCFECHGEKTAEGNLRLDRLSPDDATARTITAWTEVDERLGGRATPAMPPADKPQPKAEEVAAVRGWIKSRLTELTARDAADQKSAGRVQLRRLNRIEYNNTLRDLLAIDVDLKPLLPEDEAVAGFDNVGTGLQITRIHLERYLEAADAALTAALTQTPRPPTTVVKFSHRKDGYPPRRVVKDDTVAFFTSAPAELQQFRPPVTGLYRLRISAYAVQNEGRPLVVHVAAGDPVAPAEKYFTVPSETPTVIELTARMAPGNPLRIAPYGLGQIYIKDISAWKGPGLAVEWVEAEGPLIDQWPPECYRRLMGEVDLKKATLADAERVLADFLPRAFRRPVSERKVEQYLGYLRATAGDGNSTIAESLRQALTAVLCSPDFLLLHETPGPLDDDAIAARLSYFFWRAPPDQTLLDLASRKQLRSKGELRRQVDRMLSDPRSATLAEQFVGQWLGLRQIDATTPDRALYPEFDSYLRYSMLKEPQLFFEEMLKHDLPLHHFIDSDWSILNDRLASHYRIAGVEGPEFRKVQLPPESHRGGVLTMAAVLKVTANGTVTSPVLRGVWLHNNVLGQPLQLPSDLMVPAIEPDIRGAVNIRDQLAKHRTVAQCATCHQKIDPAGFALENFDPIGGYRTKYRALGKWPRANVTLYGRPVEYSEGLAVEAGDALPGGQRFKDSDEYKKLLLRDAGGTLRTVVEKLLVYATGSPLRPADGPAVDALVQRVSDPQHGLRTLVYELVQSDLFLKK